MHIQRYSLDSGKKNWERQVQSVSENRKISTESSNASQPTKIDQMKRENAKKADHFRCVCVCVCGHET